MAFYSSIRPAFQISQIQVYDFLAPSLLQIPRTSRTIRHPSSTSQRRNASNSQDGPQLKYPRTPKLGAETSPNPAPLSKPLTQAQRDFLSSAVSRSKPLNRLLLSKSSPSLFFEF